MKLFLMWLLGVPILVVTMAFASHAVDCASGPGIDARTGSQQCRVRILRRDKATDRIGVPASVHSA
jgi:hypothetical protein